jgi:hypothetical protein
MLLLISALPFLLWSNLLLYWYALIRSFAFLFLMLLMIYCFFLSLLPRIRLIRVRLFFLLSVGCCFLTRPWSLPSHLLISPPPLYFLFICRRRLMFRLIWVMFSPFLSFFDLNYCCTDMLRFCVLCFSFNACDDLLPLPLSLLSQIRLIRVRVRFLLSVPVKSVFLYVLNLPCAIHSLCLLSCCVTLFSNLRFVFNLRFLMNCIRLAILRFLTFYHRLRI